MTDAEKMAELLEGAAGICEIENFPAERDACTEAASLIRSQAERIRVLEIVRDAAIDQLGKVEHAQDSGLLAMLWRVRGDVNQVEQEKTRCRARAAMEPRNG